MEWFLAAHITPIFEEVVIVTDGKNICTAYFDNEYEVWRANDGSDNVIPFEPTHWAYINMRNLPLNFEDEKDRNRT